VLGRDDHNRHWRVLGPIYYRLLISGEPLTGAFVDRLVRALMVYGR
jgi:hypothetical protein